jgi:peptidyl-tRNA hydrolase, PTH2 family
MKQVIVVNHELKLPKGKLAAQVAHAAIGAYLEASSAVQQAWLDEGMPKVVLRAESVEDLLRLANLSRERGLPSCLVEDAGRTVIPEGTITCIGIGPAEDEYLDALTGDLKLL